MYSGFLSFGGNEVINNERARSYAESAATPMFWLKGPRVPALSLAVSPTDIYDAANIQNAPWFDASAPDVSTRFYGCFGIDITGADDSTRSTPVYEGISDGGLIGRSREAVKSVKVKAILLGTGKDSLEHGMGWLKSALAPNACGQHGDACGVTDFQYYSAEIPLQTGDLADPLLWQNAVDGLTRFLHGVAVVSGPFVTGVMESRGNDAWTIEFTVTAGRPWVYGLTKQIQLPMLASTVVADVSRNLTIYPSAELSTTNAVLTTNLATNPSVETDATGWVSAYTQVSGSSPSALLTNGRVTELAANAGASFRTRLLGTSTAATGRCFLTNYESVNLSGQALPAGSRLSFNIWGAIIAAGTGSTVNSFSARAEWYNGSTLLSTTSLGTGTTADYNGRAFTLPLQSIPAGATDVRVIITADVSWTSSSTASVNSDIRLYADALTVSAP